MTLAHDWVIKVSTESAFFLLTFTFQSEQLEKWIEWIKPNVLSGHRFADSVKTNTPLEVTYTLASVLQKLKKKLLYQIPSF